MQRDLFSKWTLFITSYLPLYLWLLLSNINYSKFSFERLVAFDFEHKLIRTVFVILIFVSVVKLWKLFKFDGKECIKIPRDMEISPESDSLMNYIVTYFTPLLSFDMNNTTSIFMNSLLFLLIGLMYVGSNASYLNPVLGVFGFKIFGVTGFPHAHHIITNLSFDDIETARATDVELTSYRLGDGIYILKRK
ncbi:hypothetical protein GPW67_00260 [Streptococcus thermophilus]|uniref:Uncharacterized protein n=1 Tax=Streptococcus phage 9874 TaxID=1814960 RepID=A0A191KBR1_9CAUD|nr:hypothetical protein [Streptococcus thermophilus]YP_009280366.1 hypothetical protein BIZ98_gp40 [Streptococcus phage 9874]AMQ65881.1 hypothetical protein P9874_40 [Streptococcus phage 9874]MCE2073160.1 hypothetical protein [Streptococcus thermophilus]MCE2192200.1 hypothetical protein [Streptococcus thermophilus]MCE2197487.1 hypothetical protein [Streptococcus thermophilus]MCE2198674.1 hypothetical protein [Streptococcus thermophilus]